MENVERERGAVEHPGLRNYYISLYLFIDQAAMKRRTKAGRKKSKRAAATTTTQKTGSPLRLASARSGRGKTGRASNNHRAGGGGSVVAAAVLGIGSMIGLGVALDESDDSSQQQQAIIEGSPSAAVVDDSDKSDSNNSLQQQATVEDITTYNNKITLVQLFEIVVGNTTVDVPTQDTAYDVVQEGIDYFEKCISHVADLDKVMPRNNNRNFSTSLLRLPPFFKNQRDDINLQFKLRSIYAVTYICFHRIFQKYVDVFIAPTNANDLSRASAATADLNVIKKLMSIFFFEEVGEYKNVAVTLQTHIVTETPTYDSIFVEVYSALNSKCKSLILQCLKHLQSETKDDRIHIMKFFACVRTFFKDVMSTKSTSLNKEESTDKTTMATNLYLNLHRYYEDTIIKNINKITASSCSGFPGSPFSLSSEFAKFLYSGERFPDKLIEAIDNYTSSSPRQAMVVGGGRKKVKIRVQRRRARRITRGRTAARTRTCRSVVDA